MTEKEPRSRPQPASAGLSWLVIVAMFVFFIGLALKLTASSQRSSLFRVLR